MFGCRHQRARPARVLLIGDSITHGYYPEVQARLKAQAYVARLTTSKSVGDPALLDEVALVLRQPDFKSSISTTDCTVLLHGSGIRA